MNPFLFLPLLVRPWHFVTIQPLAFLLDSFILPGCPVSIVLRFLLCLQFCILTILKRQDDKSTTIQYTISYQMFFPTPFPASTPQVFSYNGH